MLRHKEQAMKKLLVVVDMQNDFLTGALGTDEAQKIVSGVKQKIENCKNEGYQVVFTRDTHEENYMDTQEGKLLPVPHCIKGTYGWEIDASLKEMGAKIFDKPTFGSTALSEFAKRENFDKIELCGVCTDICVITNAFLLKTYLPEAEIVVCSALCAGTTPENHENALRQMKICQILVK